MAATAVLLVLGAWMLATLSRYATELIGNIPNYF
jgi:flagellar biosynthesis protein FliQ